MKSDTTLIHGLRTKNNQKGRLYYYCGNFFYPFNLDNKTMAKVKSAIRIFIAKNKELIVSDRSKSDYKNIVELFDG